MYDYVLLKRNPASEAGKLRSLKNKEAKKRATEEKRRERASAKRQRGARAATGDGIEIRNGVAEEGTRDNLVAEGHDADRRDADDEMVVDYRGSVKSLEDTLPEPLSSEERDALASLPFSPSTLGDTPSANARSGASCSTSLPAPA